MSRRKDKNRKRRQKRLKHSRTIRQINTAELPKLQEKLELCCQACGRTGRYHVGTICLLTRVANRGGAPKEDWFAFTGYFRCAFCDAPGPWAFTVETVVHLTATMVLTMEDPERSPLQAFQPALFDGTTFHYATEAEQILRDRLDKDPDQPFLWNRLGNIFNNGGCPERAIEPFRRAIELDPTDIRSHYSLGGILFDEGNLPEAVQHFHAVLRHARARSDVPKPERQGFVRNTLECLLEMNASSRGEIEVFPRPDPSLAESNPDEPVVLELMEFDLSRESDWNRLCETFLRPLPAKGKTGRWWGRRRTGPSLVRPPQTPENG